MGKAEHAQVLFIRASILAWESSTTTGFVTQCPLVGENKRTGEEANGYQRGKKVNEA